MYTLGGLYWIISGVFAFLLTSSFGGIFGQMMFASGALVFIYTTVIGSIHLGIASALFSGKNWARIITLILVIIALILGIISLFMGDITAILFVILGLFVIYYLRRPHVIAYFKGEKYSENS